MHNNLLMMRKLIFLIIAFALSGMLPAHALDLVQVHELGLQNDPQLRASRAGRNSTR